MKLPFWRMGEVKSCNSPSQQSFEQVEGDRGVLRMENRVLSSLGMECHSEWGPWAASSLSRTE